ncbi:hypothetical protein BJX96DRAFT_95588 [Aspergillus floccosus]
MDIRIFHYTSHIRFDRVLGSSLTAISKHSGGEPRSHHSVPVCFWIEVIETSVSYSMVTRGHWHLHVNLVRYAICFGGAFSGPAYGFVG